MSKKIITQYYVLSCLFTAFGLQTISAVYVTFLQEHGLNLLQVNLVNAVFFLTLFVCEIPTGAFADIFGRKSSFVLACALMSASMFVYGGSKTFIGFALAEAMCAVASTFKNGAFEAWLVDSLKHRGYEGSLARIFGRETIFNQIGGSFGAITGAYLAVRNPAWPWYWGGTVAMAVMIIAARTMQEEYFIPQKFSWRKGFLSMREKAVTSIRYGAEHKAVRFILLITFMQIYAVQAINMYWQPFFRARGVGKGYFGFIFTGLMYSLALGAFVASKVRVGGNERAWILKSQLYVGIVVILTALAPLGLPLIITIFILHELGRGFWKPMASSYLHERIPSAERATISSFCSVAPHIGGAIGLVVSGIIAQVFGISAAWVVGGIVLSGGAVLLWRNGSS